MIQRIQTVYLLLAAILSAGLIFVLELWSNPKRGEVFAEDEPSVFILFLVSALLSFVCVFLYKNRKLQFVLGRVNMLLNLILLGLFVVWSLNISGGMNISEKGIGMAIPFVSIVLLVLANKAIKKDEDLVKSVDRLR